MVPYRQEKKLPSDTIDSPELLSMLCSTLLVVQHLIGCCYMFQHWHDSAMMIGFAAVAAVMLPAAGTVAGKELHLNFTDSRSSLTCTHSTTPAEGLKGTTLYVVITSSRAAEALQQGPAARV
jgi:hypothetical protein